MTSMKTRHGPGPEDHYYLSRSCLLAVMGAVIAIMASTLVSLDAAENKSPGPQASAWHPDKVKQLAGLKVTLSTPVLVARSKGYLWFPTLIRLASGDLLALMSNYADIHTTASTSLNCWSIDGGLTWTEPKPGLYSDTHARLRSGDELLLPYYLYPRAEGGLRGPYQLNVKGKKELKLVKDGLIVTGWPRPDQSLAPNLGLAGFVFNGQTVTLTDGKYLATLYGTFKDAKRYSLVAAESVNGVQWKIRSIVADHQCKLKGREGPCEAALCRLKDGRLMCVFRLASYVPYGQVWSRDEGKTWTEAIAMDNAFSVQPSLGVMTDGMVALSGGRPGLYLWLNRDGLAREWQKIDLKANHNACKPKEPIDHVEHTSSYTEIVVLDDSHLLYIYDRIPKGWHPIPDSSTDSNSVWVVRVTVEKTNP